MANYDGRFEGFDRVRRLTIRIVQTPAGAKLTRAGNGNQSPFVEPQRQRLDFAGLAARDIESENVGFKSKRSGNSGYSRRIGEFAKAEHQRQPVQQFSIASEYGRCKSPTFRFSQNRYCAL